jgi:hypothetical protein
MISLSATTFDIAGLLNLPGARAADTWQGQRRGEVIATLDGDSVVYDTGYSVSDTTLSINHHHPTAAQITTLTYLVAYYAELILCCEAGVFAARPQFVVRGDILSLQLRLLRRLDA